MTKIDLYNMDNMELMKKYPDKYFDLALCDPEYGIKASKPSIKDNNVIQKNGKVSNIKQSNYIHKDWDNKPAGKEYFDELIRVSKHQIIFGVNYYDYKFESSGRIVWDKLNCDSDQMGCEIAYCSLNNRSDIIYFMWNGMMQGIYCGKNIFKAIIQQGNKKLNESRIHPTQKPVNLYKYLLETYAKTGDKILDTNTGSKSLVQAAIELGFDLTGCEKEKDYFLEGKNRIDKFVSQLNLFQEQPKINYYF